MPGSCFATPCVFRGRQAVCIGNDIVQIRVLTGGGHIATVQTATDVREKSGAESEDFGSPLWIPPWSTVDPALSELADTQEFGDGLEGRYLLSHIMGHNLCLDVFGDHSKGEVDKCGLAFHGEAGQTTWKVKSVVRESDGAKLRVCLAAHLTATMMDVSRTFTVSEGSSAIEVQETMKSLVGFDRALGRANHVTIGKAFLQDGQTVFHCNADRGKTWPEDIGDFKSFAVGEEFDFPDIPAASYGPAAPKRRNWRTYPYPDQPKSRGLLTLRIKGDSKWGYFSAESPSRCRRLCYVWERSAFPFLMTWEENKANEEKPWGGRTLTRGLEFSSYAFALGRRSNVALGKVLDTPAFQWLDAHEEFTTTWFMKYEETAKGSPCACMSSEELQQITGSGS